MSSRQQPLHLRFTSGSVSIALCHSVISIETSIASSRLASLASTVTMGGGPKPEHMLVILPFREPVGVFDRIRRDHPHIKITYRNLLFTASPWKGIEDVPPGKVTQASMIQGVVLRPILSVFRDIQRRYDPSDSVSSPALSGRLPQAW